MHLKVGRKRLDTVTEITPWKINITFIATFERNIHMKILINYLSGGIQSLEGEKRKFCFVMICIL